MTIPKITEDLLNRYLQNQCNEIEKSAVESWYNHISLSKKIENLENLDFEELDRYFRNTFSNRMEKTSITSISKIKKISKSKYWSAAAIFLVFLTVSLFFIHNSKKMTIEKLANESQKNSFIPGSFQGKIIIGDQFEKTSIRKESVDLQHKEIKESLKLITENGEEFESILPDGTRVYMNAGSSISMDKDYNKATRDVTLVGEAYFEVFKDPSRPFIVHVDETKIQALGTAFNVKYYPKEEAKIRTFLEEGSIQVQGTSENIILKPGQLFEYDKLSGKNRIQDNPEIDQLAWKAGFFEFNNSPLPEIMKELARWYNFSFEISPAYQDKTLSGTFNRNQSFSEVIKILEFSGLEVHKEGQNLTIKPNK